MVPGTCIDVSLGPALCIQLGLTRLGVEVRLGPNVCLGSRLSGHTGIWSFRHVQVGLTADIRLSAHVRLAAKIGLTAGLTTQIRLTAGLAAYPGLSSGLAAEVPLGASCYLRVQI